MSIALRWGSILARDFGEAALVGFGFVAVPAILGAWTRYGQSLPPLTGPTIRETVEEETAKIQKQMDSLRSDIAESQRDDRKDRAELDKKLGDLGIKLDELTTAVSELKKA